MMFSGYSVGGIIAALLAISLLPAYGQWLTFAVASLVLIVSLAYKFRPESISLLVVNGRREQAKELAHRYAISLESEAANAPPDEAST